MRSLSYLAVGTALVAVTPAAAQVRPLLDPPASAEAARAGVEVYLLNEGTAAQSARGPDEIETIARDGTRIRLIAAPDEPQSIAPGSFARVHYRLAASYPVTVAAVPLSTPPTAGQAGAGQETIASGSIGRSSGFLGRFQPFAPTYGVMGAKSSGTKLQVSFDFRLLGKADGPRLDFAYTQTIFWATDRPSGPIRTEIFSPQVFVDVPTSQTLTIGGGYAHDSNGGGVRDSIDVNRFFLRASKTIDLGGAWKATVTPQAWGYFGYHGLAPDIDRYWGYTSLGLALEQRDGWKAAVTARGNPGTGKGSAEAFLSYPLASIDDRLPHLYLIGQFFTGYGESLIDYARRSNQARFGIAFTR
ncbi:phospholipase A [Sphingomonas sp. MMS24-J45]|uniref:phospholipase A n=1 Tax=Sphingomonas sp. MMS24-J45 TaxID=3238806 RepID=UPI003850B442